MCVLMFQVYLTGMIPLAVRPNTFKHVDFGSYYVPHNELRRFANKTSWRSAIFAALEKRTEQLMRSLWQFVQAKNEKRTAPSLNLVKPPGRQYSINDNRSGSAGAMKPTAPCLTQNLVQWRRGYAHTSFSVSKNL